jgi:hypothetical protein
MGRMTNPTFLDHGAALPPGLAALAPVGGKRPVKVVELPVFRAARARLDSPFTVVRVPVASLNRASAGSRWRCGGGAPRLTLTSQEAH